METPNSHREVLNVAWLQLDRGRYGYLRNYATNEIIRNATQLECYAARYVSQWDDGAGVIVVDGLACWVDE
jgi:hypothetical protein